MKKLASIFAIATISAAANAQIIPIVGPDNCLAVGRYLMRCQYNPIQVSLTPEEPYINKMTYLEVTRQGICATQFPISISASMDGATSATYSALQAGSYALSQNQSSSIIVNVQAPFKNSAHFHTSCRISAAVKVDQVDRGQLQTTLSGLKQNALSEIAILNDRISDKSTIVSLLETTFALESLVTIAAQPAVDFTSLNEILLNSCDPVAPCTWSDQIAVVLEDPSVNIPVLQHLMLLQLGQQLDVLVPTNCVDNNCVGQLIDDTLTSAIENLRSGISISSLDAEIQNLVAQRYTLEDRLAEYRSVAGRYEITWESI